MDTVKTETLALLNFGKTWFNEFWWKKLWQNARLYFDRLKYPRFAKIVKDSSRQSFWFYGISYLLERVKGNSMLDDGKTILGIKTLWSTLLPVAKYPSVCFGYTACIPAMQVCLQYIATCYYGFMPAIRI